MTHPYRPTHDPLDEILLNDTVTSNKIAIFFEIKILNKSTAQVSEEPQYNS
jgi:hypothetical protein